MNQVLVRLDKVIKVVDTQATDSYHLDQSVQDIQQELTTLRQTVDSWNDEHQDDDKRTTRNSANRSHISRFF